MQNSKKKKGIYVTAMSMLLSLVMVFTAGCGSKGDDITVAPIESTSMEATSDDDYDYDYDCSDVNNIVSKKLFEEVVEGVSEFTYLDEHLKENNYETLLSDYVGFRDSGDFESAKQTLYQLGMHILEGSVIDTLCREDEEFISKLDEDFTLDDVEVTTGTIGEGYRGIYVTVDGGEKYAQLVSDGDFSVGYRSGGIGADMLGTLEGLKDGNDYDEERLQNVLGFFKEFMVYSGNYTDADESIMDGLGYYDGTLCSNSIEFTADGDKVYSLKK